MRSPTAPKCFNIRWEGKTLYLALDSSQLWARFTVVHLALIYRGRALPLSWAVLASRCATIAWEDYQVILQESAAVLSKGCRLILLVDRGFLDQQLLVRARDLGWSFRIRLKSSFWIYRANKPRARVRRLMPAKGQSLFLNKVWITNR